MVGTNKWNWNSMTNCCPYSHNCYTASILSNKLLHIIGLFFCFHIHDVYWILLHFTLKEDSFSLFISLQSTFNSLVFRIPDKKTVTKWNILIYVNLFCFAHSIKIDTRTAMTFDYLETPCGVIWHWKYYLLYQCHFWHLLIIFPLQIIQGIVKQILL